MPTLEVFTPRAVIASVAQLPLLQEWTRKHERFDAARALSADLEAHDVPFDQRGHLVFTMHRSEDWWDLLALLQCRGWRAVYERRMVVKGLPTFVVCTCGSC